MQYKYVKYLILTSIFVISVILTWWFYEKLFMVFGVSTAVSLVGILYQILKDESDYQKNIALNFGITSHMATKAFDKHVEFSELYIEKYYLALPEIFKEGVGESCGKLGEDLRHIRKAYILWLDRKLSNELEKIELTLIKMAHWKRVAKSAPHLGDAITKKLSEGEKDYWNIFEANFTSKREDSNLQTSGEIEEKLANLLGVGNIIKTKEMLIKKANSIW